ncbi:MAG: hypothetical protein EOO88_58470, partial [Pedobacter sp.]
MERKNLILIGAGGHCKSCIDVIETEGKFHIKGILDLKDKVGQQVCNYPIIGTDEDIAHLVEQGYHFLITVGQIKNAAIRKNLYQHLKSLNATIATVVSPKAHVSNHAGIGEGSIVMHGVTLNAGAAVGVNAILNTSCTVEHDAQVGDHCHIHASAHQRIRGCYQSTNKVHARALQNLIVRITRTA